MVSSRDVVIHSPEEVARIRRAAQATAHVRDALAEKIEAGMSTREIDAIAGCLIAETGGRSTFLGYSGYPCNVCISVNEVVVHGIADDRTIVKDGDIVSIDVGVTIDGATGDTARTVPVGKVSDEVERLLAVTREALMQGIAQAKAGNRVGDISQAVEQCATTWGTAAASNSTSRRKSRTSAPLSRGRCWCPAWCWRSNLCSTSAHGRSSATATTGRSAPATASGRRILNTKF